jgi:hypothetical protein
MNLPHPPHLNTIFDGLVFGCGRIPPGNGAAASFNGVHFKGKIRLAGGFDTLAESRWAGQIGPSIPVKKFSNTTINRRVPGWSTNWSWNGKAAIFDAWWGGKE